MVSERRFADTMLELADTLVADFDVVDFLHTLVLRCVELLDASDAGLMLADQRGGLQIVAYTSKQAHALEYFELSRQEGPCLDCFRTGEAIMGDDLELDPPRWPRFAPVARSAGFRSVQALPMRWHDQVIGALNVFHQDPLPLDQDKVTTARALADIATIGILHERSVSASRMLAEQLQSALNSRVVIEQAKGIIAEQGRVSMDEAFALMRSHARSRNQRLGRVAEAIIDRSLSAKSLAG